MGGRAGGTWHQSPGPKGFVADAFKATVKNTLWLSPASEVEGLEIPSGGYIGLWETFPTINVNQEVL